MLVETKQISKAEYLEEVVKMNTKSLFYHSKNWIDLIVEGIGYEAIYLKTVRNGIVLALSPILVRNSKIIRLAGSPLRGSYTEYMGPVMDQNISDEDIKSVIKSLHKYIIKNNVSYLEWRFAQDSPVYDDQLMSDGYSISICKSQVIDTSDDIENIWNNMQGRARNTIRKFEKSKYIIESREIVAYHEIKQYYHILESTFKRQGLRNPHGFKFFRTLANSESLRNNLRYYFVKGEGNLISGAIFLIFENRMMYLSGVSTYEGNKTGANSAIQWEAIKYANENDVLEYDMGGLGVDSIDKFKKSFGGVEIIRKRYLYRTCFARYLEKLYFFLQKIKQKIRA